MKYERIKSRWFLGLFLALPLAFCGCGQKDQLRAEIDSLRLQMEAKRQQTAQLNQEIQQVQKQINAAASRQRDPIQLRKLIESNKAAIESLKAEQAAEQSNLEHKQAILDGYRAKYYIKN